MRGRIIRGIAGFYYVQTGNQIYECKAKGIFRKDKKKPLPGDYVEIDILDETALTANISVILPRTNEAHSSCGGQRESGSGHYGGGKSGTEPEPAGSISGDHGTAEGGMLYLFQQTGIW